MDLTISPGLLCGTVNAIPSKSQAHRLLICAAFADNPTRLLCPETNQDIEATAQCLRALGANITKDDSGYTVEPIVQPPQAAVLACGESGSTLRFMLPIAGALGVSATFLLEGRLPQRPLSPLWEEMERMGCTLTRPTDNTILCQGQLQSGTYCIDGSISSQFITGLLFAMALLPGNSQLQITGKLESRPYVEMTQLVLQRFGVNTENYTVSGSIPFHSPGTVTVEGDWSNGAFFLAAQAMGNPLTVTGLLPDSPQGDKACAQILAAMTEHITVDASNIPDLVPILAVAAGTKHGAVFTNIRRLRLKESDRVEAVLKMLHSLSIRAEADENTLRVYPGAYCGCTIDAVGDHRIAMAAAIAATVATGPVTVLGAQCVSKSYPAFWEEYQRLGGCYEQYIR